METKPLNYTNCVLRPWNNLRRTSSSSVRHKHQQRYSFRELIFHPCSGAGMLQSCVKRRRRLRGRGSYWEQKPNESLSSFRGLNYPAAPFFWPTDLFQRFTKGSKWPLTALRGGVGPEEEGGWRRMKEDEGGWRRMEEDGGGWRRMEEIWSCVPSQPTNWPTDASLWNPVRLIRSLVWLRPNTQRRENSETNPAACQAAVRSVPAGPGLSAMPVEMCWFLFESQL